MNWKRSALPSQSIVFTLMLFFCTVFALELQSQTCVNPPQNLVNGDFEQPATAITTNSTQDINNLMPGWFVSHGHPTTQASPPRSMWLWSSNDEGEGVFNCFDFQKGEEYRICFDLQTNGLGQNAQVHVIAATGLNANNSGIHTIPSTTASETIWQDQASNYNSTNWTRISILYSPYDDYNQIWFLPYWDGTGAQVEMTIDNVVIEHIPAGTFTVSADTTICPGDTAQLNATGGHVYSWAPPTGLSCTNCPNPTASPSATTVYRVSITNNYGCGPVTASRRVTVNVDQCSVDADYTYVKNSCTDVQFTDISTASPCTQIIGWHWDFGYPGGTSTQQNPLHTFPNPGTYTVCLTTFGDDGNMGCFDQQCYEIEVGPCEIDAQFGYNFMDDCNSIQFNDSSIVGPCSQISGWAWDFGHPGGTSTQQSPLHSFPGPGTYQVCLTTFAHNGFVGCFDTICTTVTVGLPCDIDVDYTYYQPTANCLDLQFFDASQTNWCTRQIAWHWDFGDGTTGTVQNPLHSFPGPGTYTVCYRVWADNGSTVCVDDTCYDITINATCEVNADFVYSSQGCIYGQFYNTSTWSSCTQNIHYQWDFGYPGGTSTQQDPNHTFPGPGSYYVCLTTMGDNGFMSCIDDTCFWVDIGDPCSIDAYPTQTINDCAVQFTDSTDHNPCMYNIQWQWDFGDGHVSNAQNPAHTYTHPGTYTVCLTITGTDGNVSCIDDTCYNITVNCPEPCVCNTQADFSYMLDRCDVSFSDLSIPNSCTSITGWRWDFGDGSPHDFSQYPFHTYPATGFYNVCLDVYSTDGNVGCVNTICKMIYVDCSTPSAPPSGGNGGNSSTALEGMDVSVFPNPSSGNVYIEFNGTHKSPMNIDVLSSTGQLIKVLHTSKDQKDVRTVTWSPKEDQLPTGIYYIRIRSGNEVQVKKVLFENR